MGIIDKNNLYNLYKLMITGLQVFINKFNLSFDFVSNSLKTAEFKIGLGININ